MNRFYFGTLRPYAGNHEAKPLKSPAPKANGLMWLGFVNRECSFTSLYLRQHNQCGRLASMIILSHHFKDRLYWSMDNASIQKILSFKKNIERWQQSGLL